ncbi:MAG: carbon monoxide dehydrogenase large chain [Pseudomonadota bacterium]|jgi:carbon-monoxide dehydrogenase large subunit
MGEFALGQSVSRFEDPRLLRGGGRFTDDFTMPGMAHGYVVRANVAHARILSIDTTAALRAPGVIAVLTHSDWAAAGFTDLPVGRGRSTRRDGSPMYRPVHPALVSDRVRWVGDHVAFVVAETLEQAMDAAELVEIEYDPLPAAVGTGDVTQPGAPLVWDDCPDNICYVQQYGDKEATDRAFAEADHVVSQRFVINRVTAATMEPRACLGHYDRADDRYTVRMTAQRPFRMRQLIAQVMQVPESKVRLIAGDVGGSFGMKGSLYAENMLVLLASRVTGRPVKWTATRTEAFLGDCSARDNFADVSIALDKNGIFKGLRLQNIVNVGAYLHAGGEGAAISNIGTFAGVYRIPAIHTDVTTVFSNTNPLRSYRGNGRPEAAYNIERLVDIAADELGIDPVEIRRRNMIGRDEFPYKTSLRFTYDCGDFEKTMDMALEIAEYAGFEARRAASKARGKLRGMGVSYTIEKAASPGYEGAEIRFDRAGSVTILCGAGSQGQGHETVLKQLVCDRLGIDPGEVTYVQGDTDAVFYGEGSGSSRTATIGGAAMHMATEKIVAKASTIAAHLLGVEDVSLDAGVFTSRQTNETVTIKDVAKAASQPAKLPKGMEPGLIAQHIFQLEQANFPNGCHLCEIEIDEDTGEVEVLRYTVADDVGTVMNPLLLKGQIKGGVVQGLGQALLEDVRYDPESGQLLTASFMDYPIPHAKHVSNFAIVSNPVPTKTNPLGVKGAGEAGAVGAVPAVANAVIDALSVYGIRHLDMPMTPARIWRAIQDARSNR